MRDSVRLRSTPRCVCGLLGVRWAVHDRTGTCPERPRFAPRRTLWTHALPTSVRAGPGSRATCSPLAGLGTKVASAGGVSPCLADLLGKGFLLYPRTDQCPKWWWLPIPTRAVFHLTCWPLYPFGLYSSETRNTQKHPSITLSAQVTSAVKDSDESIIQPGGWKHHASSTHMRDRGAKVITVTSRLEWEE